MILNIHIYKVLAGPLTRLARRDDLFCFYFCFAFIFFLLFCHTILQTVLFPLYIMSFTLEIDYIR